VAALLEDRKGHFAVSWMRYLDNEYLNLKFMRAFELVKYIVLKCYFEPGMRNRLYSQLISSLLAFDPRASASTVL